MRRMLIILFIGILFTSLAHAASPIVSGNYEIGTFRNGEYPLLFEMHNRMIGGEIQSFAFPVRKKEFRHELCDSCFWKINGTLNASVWNSGFGGEAYVSGFVDSLDFDIDAKFNWIRETDKNFAELDGESVHEVWDDGNDWINYTRYRGHVGYNYAWLRMEVGRDAMHWGPGFYNNLTLNRQAVPYNYFSVDLVFGPLRVISFYSKMRIDSANVYTHEKYDRNLYGHRYEFSLGKAAIGVNELQIVYNENNPWLIVPIFPLFIEKGNYSEENNNGALSFDINYQIGKLARIYGEFFLDDMDSPIAVIKSKYLDSEWAWMLGAQIGQDFLLSGNLLQLGTIFEISHVEQLVYSHYASYQGQLANAGKPLGNPMGPNSRKIDWLIYGKFAQNNENVWIASLLQEFSWKGNNYGSDLNANIRAGFSPSLKREYLGGAKMHYSITPTLTFVRQHWGVSGSFRFGYDAETEVKGWVKW